MERDWSQFAAEASKAIAAAGNEAFAEALFRWIDAIVGIDSCAVFAFDQAFHPRHVFTFGRLEPRVGEALADDYTRRFASLDPGVRQAMSPGHAAECVLAFEEIEDYPDFYLDHFFARNGLVDKAVVIHSARREHVYCNFYRMRDSGRFSDDDWRKLRLVLPLAGLVIANHAKRVRDALHTVAQTSFSSQIVNDLAASGRPPFHLLAPRECEVCARILLGLTTEGIALDLGIAASTVITHRRRAYQKLGISSQKELFRLCLEESAREHP